MLNVQATAQSMSINFTDGSTAVFPITEIQSINYDNNLMNLNFVQGNQLSYDLGSIDYFSYLDFSTALSHKEEPDGSVKVYPNPSNDQVFVEFVNAGTGIVTIDVHDLNGRRIGDRIRSSAKNGIVRIVLNDGSTPLQAGMYICSIRTGERVMNTKFSIQ